ncbi:DUF5719 family protein [Microbacterium sp. NPDC055903]
MTSNKAATIAVTGVRLAVGAVVAVGCVFGVTAAVALPWPSISGTTAETAVTTVPADAALVCTGAFHALGRDVQDASALESVGSSRITDGGDPVSPDSVELAGSDGAASAQVFTAEVQDRQAPLVAASESQRLAEEDLSGLAAGSCEQASTESWIVGGSIQTGATDVLVLANPGSVTATVTLTVYGEEQSASTVILPAQTQTGIPFASIAAGETEPIVRVTAEGAPVRASLQSALMSTLEPAGVDVQSSTGVVGQELVFAGMQVVALGEGNATDALRLLAVDADTEAQVTVRDVDGRTASTFTAPLSAGVPLEVALGDLEIGTYSVEVLADVPLVGGLWQGTGTGGGTDFAWMTPSPVLEDDALFAVPSGPRPALHLLGDPESDAVVTLTRIDGSAQEIRVAAGASELVDLRASSLYRISTDAPVRAAVTMAGEGQLAGWPVSPGPGAQQVIGVVP